MRILAVSDQASRSLYDHYEPGRLRGYDLILACGDLKKEYLEFLVTMANVPLLYVRGNHDEGLSEHPPEGCVCIDGRLYVHEGVRILGLGGSFRYRPGENRYTEGQMRRRILRLLPAIWRRRGFDILVTHAPARGLGDLDTRAHRGFECFRDLLDRYAPRYFVHGHVHRNYGMDLPQRREYGGTVILNAWDHCVFEFPEE